MTGRLTRSRQGNTGDVETQTGLMELGQHTLAHKAGLSSIALSQQHAHLAKLGIGTAGDEERRLQMGPQLALHLLNLNLNATRANNIILAP